MVRPMVHSTKHYVQQSIGSVAAGAKQDTDLVVSVDVGAKNTVSEIEEGNSVKAVYIELWVRSSATAASSFVFVVLKRPSALGAPTIAEIAALGDYTNKKNVLYVCQGLTNDVDSTALAVHKGWIKIPKSKQRFGLGDKLSWHLSVIGQGMNFCGFSTYKEYS